MFSFFDIIPECRGHRDGQKDGRTDCQYRASHNNKTVDVHIEGYAEQFETQYRNT